MFKYKLDDILYNIGFLPDKKTMDEKIDYKACVAALSKICDFFRASVMTFMLIKMCRKIKTFPMFGKYALMFGDDTCNLEYASVDSKSIKTGIETFPLFISKQDMANIDSGQPFYLINYVELLKDTYFMVSRLLEAAAKDMSKQIWARNMTSMTIMDKVIWKKIGTIEELLVRIDMGQTLGKK